MKPDVKWINRSQRRRTKNIVNWKDDEVYSAHSIETPGFVPYISKVSYDMAIEALRSNNSELQQKTLRDLGEA